MSNSKSISLKIIVSLLTLLDGCRLGILALVVEDSVTLCLVSQETGSNQQNSTSTENPTFTYHVNLRLQFDAYYIFRLQGTV
jgi:hypothetical protein